MCYGDFPTVCVAVADVLFAAVGFVYIHESTILSETTDIYVEIYGHFVAVYFWHY